jgi:hypothetical protein
MKKTPLIMLLLLSTHVLAVKPAYLTRIGSAKGGQEWFKHLDQFKKTKNPKLVTHALKLQPLDQNEAAQRAIKYYDMLMISPKSFIQGAAKFDPSFNCLFKYIIPRTQFIKYKDLKINKINIKSKLAQSFKDAANLYYKYITGPKLSANKFQCEIYKKNKKKGAN